MPADAHVFIQPLIQIVSTDYACYAKSVRLTAEDKMADAETFCSPGLEIPSTTTWTVDVVWKQSYGTAELWNALNAIAKTKVAMTIRPETGTIAVTNPQADFEVYLPTPDFIDAGVGDSMEWTMSAKVVGAPVFTTA